MASPRSIFLLGGLFALAHAFTQPTTATWGPLQTPNLSSPVTQGNTYTVTWDPETHSTDGVTVSLVLCHGPSTNCVTASSAIVEGVPAAQKSYSWSVPCDLPTGTQSTDTGYGMLIIVDGTGEFQYSTQFSVLENPKGVCGSSGSGSSSSPSSSQSSPPSAPSGSPSTYSGGAWNGTSSSTTTTTESATATNTVAFTTLASTSAAASSSVSFGGPTLSFASATPATAATATASAFSGAAAHPRATNGIVGLVAGGALAMLAL